MTIEQWIDVIVEEHWPWNDDTQEPSIDWSWKGIHHLDIVVDIYGPEAHADKIEDKWVKKTYELIIDVINKADESECLTSRSEYVRECKKYLMENK